MTSISLPNPVIRPSGPAKADVDALERDLRRQVDGEVRFDAGSRAAYSTDASNYRQVPIGVVVPRTVEAGAAAVEVCRRHGAPVVSRGGGTSLAGQTCNVAVVIDWSKYCHGLVSVDPAARTAIVEPGIVLDELNAKLAEHKLMLKLVPVPAARTLVVLGYPDIASAADATPHIAPHQPEQLEGVDERLITFERERRMTPKALHLLPEGHGWLMVIFAGGSKDDADAKACAASRSARSAPRRRPPPTTPSSPPWPGWPQAPSRSSPRCSAAKANDAERFECLHRGQLPSPAER
jgi:FAD/FMN-containing dehydrogenase